MNYALRPGEYVITDASGRRFTTANDRGYAIRLSIRFGGLSSVTVCLFGQDVIIHPEVMST